jgi:hypothetical protein
LAVYNREHEVTGKEMLLIGVDGGATAARAHAVSCDDLHRPSSFELRPESASRVYTRVADFAPLPVAEQLAQRDAGDIKCTDKEVEQGRRYVQAAAEAVIEVAQQCAATRVLVGIGMPGLKTPDGRGINTINNGPRMPDYLELLEKHIAAAGIALVSPIAALGSDADYCGLGEEYAADGLFRGVENAYYVGCGTGIADAMKLRGKLVPFDTAKSWIQKSWQIASALGPTFEKLVSAKSLNRVYADVRGATKRRSDEATKDHVAAGPRTGRSHALGGTAVPAVGAGESTARGAVAHGGSGPRARPAVTVPHSAYPEVAAAAGDAVAIAWMSTAALVLAELIFERLWTIKNGRADAPHRGDAYAQLDSDHEFRGTLLDRVIIGQRVGQIYADPAYREVFGDKLDADLVALIAGSEDAEMRDAYLQRSAGPPRPAQLKPGFVLPSKLRAAPALGAAVAAVQALDAGGQGLG